MSQIFLLLYKQFYYEANTTGTSQIGVKMQKLWSLNFLEIFNIYFIPKIALRDQSENSGFIFIGFLLKIDGGFIY